jgi:hypothetical protein
MIQYKTAVLVSSYENAIIAETSVENANLIYDWIKFRFSFQLQDDF